MNQKIISIKDQISIAIERGESLKIVGGNSKAFLGRATAGIQVEMADYTGIISYEPTELFITVRAGTLLSEVNKTLAEQGQMLAFEPAKVNEKTTMGGIVATGLSGPRRPYAGSVRDFVLGIRCINGLSKELSFGGQVMKNVAGYDLSRLLTGSFGTLGVILEITLKVLPLPEFELSGYKKTSKQKALEIMRALSGKSIPISAASYDGDLLFVRFSGNEKAVKDSLKKAELEEYKNSDQFWGGLRDYKLPIFNSEKPMWRLSVPSTSDVDLVNNAHLIDWGGAQYWFASDGPANKIFEMAETLGGSALLFRGGDRNGHVFQPLSSGLLKLHQELKKAFDPHAIFNSGKMYASL